MNSDSDSSQSSAGSDRSGKMTSLHATFVSGHILPVSGRTVLCNFPIISKTALICPGAPESIVINTDDICDLAVLALDTTLQPQEDYVVIDHLKW